MKRIDSIARTATTLLLALLGGSEPGYGQVTSELEITPGSAGFVGAMADSNFGQALAPLGDLDGDGTGELAVGDPATLSSFGSVWILFLNPDGTVKAEQPVSNGNGGFTGNHADRFGYALASLGDLDGDGLSELAVGNPSSFPTRDDVVWILFLNADGTVRSQLELAEGKNGLAAGLQPADDFGASVARVDDLDGDGVPELAVGATGTDEVRLLFLAADGSVKHQRLVSPLANGPEPGSFFGVSLACPGDLDGDGHPELVVGAPQADENQGALWVLFLDGAGGVVSQRKIGAGHGGFTGDVGGMDLLGASLAALGDRDGDGLAELAAGAPGSGFNWTRGGAWTLFLARDGGVKGATKIGESRGGFGGTFSFLERFGAGVADLGDVDGDGSDDLAVGMRGLGVGSVWITFLRPFGPATEVLRNGAPPNPVLLHPGATAPVPGAVWDPVVVASGPAPTWLLLSTEPASIPLGPLGRLLCHPGSLEAFAGTSAVPFAIPIASDPTLIGRSACAQGVALGAGDRLRLGNALDVTIGTFDEGQASFAIRNSSLGCLPDPAVPGLSCGAVDVVPGDELRLTFSQPVDLFSVGSATFSVVDLSTGLTPPASFSVDAADGRVLVYRPILTSGHTYSLRVAGALSDPGPFVTSLYGASNQARYTAILNAL